MLNFTVPVYVPAGSCTFRFEAVTVTLVVAPASSMLLVGLLESQFAPSLVCATADKVPGEPQFVTATV